MGVDCRITLPGNVRLDDVAKVIAISAGMVKYKNATTGYVQAANIYFNVFQEIPNCVSIFLNQEAVDGQKHKVLFHFEYGENRLLAPRSTPFWIAIGCRLADFFGGSVDYNDCDATDVDYEVPFKSNEMNCPEDGDGWQNLQDRLGTLEPLTMEEISMYNGAAAY